MPGIARVATAAPGCRAEQSSAGLLALLKSNSKEFPGRSTNGTSTICLFPLTRNPTGEAEWPGKECLEMGDTWVHLRECLSCGHIGCCDSSKNKHATKHFNQTRHPVMQSFEPGEDWRWCYVDEVFLD